ncbi:GNAT family N-acetyltransferase [Cellulosimicrobium terreum]|nr:GNAT family N-acetyltransferase [Cellulosimicrobium terreum]
MHLRDYQPADAGATLDVFVRAIRVTASGDYTPEQIAAWAPDVVDLESWAARRAALRTCVACAEDRVVGFTDVDAAGYVDMMFVDPDAARRGVASALLAWAVRTATDDGAVELTTHASRTARPFFERHGFVVVREQHPVLRGVEMVNFAMRRPLVDD